MTKRKIGIALVVAVIFVAVPLWLYTYSEDTTHPALTWEIVDLFNRSFPEMALTDEEREWVIKGSQDEDTWPRWINHFYNPETNQGWQAEYFGSLSSSTARQLTKVLLSDYPPVAAKYWAVLPEIQSQYASFGGNRTWQRALFEWSHGNKKEAYYTLGHILHLLEDMTVPDHTRNDTHAHPLKVLTGDSGSPYELFTKKYMRTNGRTNVPITAQQLAGLRLAPVVLPTLSAYFDYLANYSYRHFFSKDTIQRYTFPTVLKHDDEYGYGRDSDGSIFPLVRRRLIRVNGFSLLPAFTLDDPIADAPILQEYYLRLSRQAIRYGAGAVALFRQEADAALVSAGNVALPKEKQGVNSALNTLKTLQQGVVSSMREAVSQVVPQVLGEKIIAPTAVSVESTTTLASVALPVVPVVEEMVQVQPFYSEHRSGSGGVGISSMPVLALALIATPVTTTIPTDVPTSVATITAIVPPTTTESVPVIAISSTPAEQLPLVVTTTSATSSTEGIAENSIPRVVINEIAWAGTSVSYPNDEWFELYNSTDSAIDITNWKIVVGGNVLFLKKVNNSSIPAHGYMLFEKQRDETIREITADSIYSDVAFRDSGDSIQLFDSSGAVVDEVDFSAGWPEYDRKLPVERKVFTTTNSNGWVVADDFRIVGRTFNGGVVYGSPRQANTGNVALTFRQETAKRTLTKAENPYVLGYYEIPAGTELLLEPGVVIKSYFADSKIEIFGSLKTAGGETVVLTSGKETPTPGDWQGLWFHPGSSGDLRNVTLSYAGKPFRTNNTIFATYISQAIRAERANLTMNGSQFLSSRSTTLYVKETPITVSDSVFDRGERAIESVGSPVSLQSVVVSNYSDSKSPLHIFDFWPKLNAMQFASNTFDGPGIFGVTIKESERIVADWPYHLNNIIVPVGLKLNVSAGSNIFFSRGSIIDVYGTFIAEGLPGQPVRMSAFEKGQTWDSIRFSNAFGVLQYVNMFEGNGNVSGRSEMAGMIMLNSDSVVHITDSLLMNADNVGHVVYSADSSVLLKKSTLGHTEKPTWKTTGVGISGGQALFDDVYFTHLEIGIRGFDSSLENVSLETMDENHFIDVTYPFDPPLVVAPPLE